MRSVLGDFIRSVGGGAGGVPVDRGIPCQASLRKGEDLITI